MIKRLVVLFAVAMLGTAATASAATYYVSPGTQATQDGSVLTPFNSLDQAFAASGTWSTGDVVLVGQGNYTPGGSFNVPAGVTLKGGYKGGWGAGAWTAQNTALYASAVTYGGANMFNLNKLSVIDGLVIDSQGYNDAVVYLNDVGARFKHSTIYARHSAFYVQAQGVTIETSKVFETGNGCCWWPYYVVRVDNNYVATIQDNVFSRMYGHRTIYTDSNSKTIIRRNQFTTVQGYSGAWTELDINGYSHIYQNSFDGLNRQNTAISQNSGYLQVIENNNFTRYSFVEGQWAYDEYWGWDFPQIFRNNVLWDNGSGPGSEIIDYGYTALANGVFQGNCIENSWWYLDSYEGTERYGTGMTDFQAANDSKVSGNTDMTAAMKPASSTGSACSGKGITAASMKSKPFAHGFAYDDVTGQTYAPDTGVNPGIKIHMEGEYNSWNGDESIQFEGGNLTYLWTKVSGPALTLWSTPGTITTGNATLGYGKHVTAIPQTPGIYVFQLQVRNDNAWSDHVISDPALVTFTVQDKIKVLTSTGSVRGSFSWLQPALDAAQSGDTVQLPAGIYKPGENSRDYGQLYGKNDITIRGAGAGAGGTQFYQNCQDNAFDIEYSQNITVRDIAFYDPQDCDNYYAVYAYESMGVLVTNILVSNKGRDPWSGYGVYGEYSQITVSNSTFEYMYDAVYIYGGQAVVTGNRFTAIYDYAVEIEEMTDSYSTVDISNNVFDARFANDEYSIYLYDLYYKGPYTVRNNVFSNNYYDAIYLYYMYEATPIVIEGNTIYNDRRWDPTTHYDYGIEIEYANADIRNNIISGTGYSNIYVYNDCCSGGEEVAVQNNVLTDAAQGYYGIENSSGMDCYGGNSNSPTCRYTTWAANNLIHGASGGSYYHVDVRDGNINQDPLFVNADTGNFAIMPGSPLAGSGIEVRGSIPAAPANLVGQAIADGVRISFDAVDGATGYTLFWGDKADQYVQSKDLGAERVATITGLAAVPYYFAVSARNAFGVGDKSKSIVLSPVSKTVELSKPEVFGVEPSMIKANTEVELTVTGSGYADGATVYVGSAIAGSVTKIDGNTLKVKTTKMAAGIYPIIVVNADLGRGALAQALTVYKPYKATTSSSGGCSSTGGTSADGGLVLLLLPFGYLALRRRKA